MKPKRKRARPSYAELERRIRAAKRALDTDRWPDIPAYDRIAAARRALGVAERDLGVRGSPGPFSHFDGREGGG